MKVWLIGLSSLLAAVATSASAQGSDACFWHAPRNLPLPETNARYWRADFRLLPGEKLILMGDFPHARQMSFNLHRASNNAALASVTDVDLVPDPGSTNPYRTGANREARHRSFSLVVDPRRPSSPGVLGAQLAGPAAFDGRLLYRSYLTDQAKPGGGVPLPTVWLVGTDGNRKRLGSNCPDPASVDTQQQIGPTRIPPAPGEVTDPIQWRGSATPAGSSSGDLLVNRDNAYAYALTDFRRGDVLVLRGKAPTHPDTFRGNRRMGYGQVRYWSICTYRHPSDRSAGCVADEAIPLDRDRQYTVVISPADKRPVNARPECGVAWLDAMTVGEGALLLRHVVPDRHFRNTPLNITADQLAGDVLGPFEPKGSYVRRAEFEKQGCSASR